MGGLAALRRCGRAGERATIRAERLRRAGCEVHEARDAGAGWEALDDAEARWAAGAVAVDHTDGLSVDHADWRFNLRKSNTEPLVRLNVEARGDADLMRARTGEILAWLDAQA